MIPLGFRRRRVPVLLESAAAWTLVFTWLLPLYLVHAVRGKIVPAEHRFSKRV